MDETPKLQETEDKPKSNTLEPPSYPAVKSASGYLELPNATSSMSQANPADDTSYIVPPSVDLVLPIPGVLPGLEFLVGLYHIFVRPVIDVEEIAAGFQSCLRYEVVNISGGRVYTATEDSGNFQRGAMRENRPFEVHIYDNAGTLVMTFKRPFNCALCYWGGTCCGSNLLIHHGNGQLLGKIIQRENPVTPKFDIFDDDGQKVFVIRGPFGLSWRWILRQFDFYVCHPDDRRAPEFGKITKEWGGRNPNMFSQVDTGVEFPGELDPLRKALLLGAVFMLEFQFIEPHKRNPKWNSQSCTGNKILIGTIFLVAFLVGIYYFATSDENTKLILTRDETPTSSNSSLRNNDTIMNSTADIDFTGTGTPTMSI